MWIAPKTWTSDPPPHGSTLTAGRPASTSARCCGVRPTWAKSAASLASTGCWGAPDAKDSSAARHRRGLSIVVMGSPHEHEVGVGRYTEGLRRPRVRREGREVGRVLTEVLLERVHPVRVVGMVRQQLRHLCHVGGVEVLE